MKFPLFFSLWLPVIIWEALIFYLSGIAGLELTNEPVANFVTRKSAHLIEYSILGFLLYRAFQFRRRKTAYYIGFVLAITDEFHQSFVPERTAKFSDLIFDGVGIYLGLLSYDLIIKHGIFNKIRSRNQKIG